MNYDELLQSVYDYIKICEQTKNKMKEFYCKYFQTEDLMHTKYNNDPDNFHDIFYNAVCAPNSLKHYANKSIPEIQARIIHERYKYDKFFGGNAK